MVTAGDLTPEATGSQSAALRAAVVVVSGATGGPSCSEPVGPSNDPRERAELRVLVQHLFGYQPALAALDGEPVRVATRDGEPIERAPPITNGGGGTADAPA